MKFSIAATKAALFKEDSLFRNLDVNLRKNITKCYVWITALCGAATWTVPKVDLNCLERFEMWYCGRIAVISWTDRVKNEEVLQRIAENYFIQSIKQCKLDCTWHQYPTINQRNVQIFFLDIYVTIAH